MGDQKTSKTCSCCGGDAGKWLQWHNRDTGWGMCRNCIDWLVQRDARDGTPEAIHELYGIPGVHHEPAYYETFGRKFVVLAEFRYSEENVTRANQFMRDHVGACLLHADEQRIVLAHADDGGVLVA